MAERKKAYEDPRKRRPDRTQNERIREHYENTRRSKKKRIFALTVSSVIVIVLLMTLVATVAFKIENISIEGDCVYSVQKLCEVGGFEEGQPLVLVDRKAIERNIVRELAYVDSVTVRKKLPNTLILEIRSAYDSFAVDMGSMGYVVFSAGGKIVTGPTAFLPEGCAEVIGLHVSSTALGEQICSAGDERFALFTEFINGCARSGLIEFTKIDVSDPFNITAVYQGRIRLLFGGISKIALKAAGAVEIIRRDYSLSPDQYAQIDLTDPERAYGKNVAGPNFEDALQTTDPAAFFPATGSAVAPTGSLPDAEG